MRTWSNAWRNDRNHDAAWVFLRVEQPGRASQPAPLDPDGPHGATSIADIHAGSVIASTDAIGAFVQPSVPLRGDVGWRVRLALDRRVGDALRSNEVLRLRAYALEMVHIPAGGFTIGDPGEASLDYASFYRSDAVGERAGLYHIEDESPIPVGPVKGALYHRHSRFAQYEGDRAGPVPAAFPKGTQPFYMMKYEVSQCEYAAFLNDLGAIATGHRAPIGHRDYLTNRGTIRLEDGVYRAEAPARPANFVSWDDGCAFADWAGLRPMTELEFTKACRGPGSPLAGEFPWNTDNKDALARIIGSDGELNASGAADEALLNDWNRPRFGASYFWVMDLAGSLWERCVTIGHPSGRAFEGTHGDGRLTELGFATNEDWPAGDDDGGGYGYRGGGHYELSRDYEPGNFNPHSPIGWRRFGSWGGAPRHVAYGFRCVRLAPLQTE